MDNNCIISRDKKLNPEILQILNETYNEFIQMYGEKHSSYIKEKIESMTDKVKKVSLYYTGPIASAHSEKGIIYSESKILFAVLKHELWHVFNNSANDRNVSLQHIPIEYIQQLDNNGYMKQQYTKKMEEYKEKFRDEPERLKFLLTDYENYRDNKFDFDDSPVEMWTEWFSTQTHLNDMEENFWDWGEGYFTRTKSSDSYYDSYINVASMISCLIPKEKLLDMYLNTKEYKTGFSFPEMQKEFDEKYADALQEEDKDKYKYPYLKIMMNVKEISENARINPEIALEKLNDSMKICFNAYCLKLENIKDIDIEKAKEIYSEIKFMQEHMVWNVDINKMQDEEYIVSLGKVQNKFREMLSSLDLEDSEINQMYTNIDYTIDNPFEIIPKAQKIVERITDDKSEDKNKIAIIDNYKTMTDKNGIKNNLYNSLFSLLGEKKYKLMFTQYANEENEKSNDLIRIVEKIEKANNNEEFKLIYEDIYELYSQKLENTLNVEENIELEFREYSKEIVELQKNGLFDENTKSYLPGLERVISIYNSKAMSYESKIDVITQNSIKEEIEQGSTQEQATIRANFIPNMYKQKLDEQRIAIDKQRENQLSQMERIKRDNYFITPLQVGKATINVPTIDKMNAQRVQNKNMLRSQEENIKI